MVNLKDLLKAQKIRQAYDGLKAIKKQGLSKKEKRRTSVETKT